MRIGSIKIWKGSSGIPPEEVELFPETADVVEPALEVRLSMETPKNVEGMADGELAAIDAWYGTVDGICTMSATRHATASGVASNKRSRRIGSLVLSCGRH